MSDGNDCVTQHRDALAIWTGAPFVGLDGFGAFREETLRLNALRLVAERAVVEAEIASGNAASVVPRLDALAREFPFDEGLRGLHMRALYRSGRQADALASFNQFRSHLAEELGLDPSAELQSLELQILQQDESLDQERHEPPPVGRPSGLPNRYSSFFGREAEITETADRMAGHRLVSLVGPGGIGKSSIALEAARDLQGGDVSVVHVPIESVGKGDVANFTARSIGLEPAPNVDPVNVISGYLATRPHVLVLDGCEAHIAEVAHLADRLLSMTDCALLATSREPLGLNGESTIRVDSLPVEVAVEVFRDRAQLPEDLDDGTLQTIKLVCLAVDGMPLAVELAAARSRAIPLDRLADRLSDQIPLLKRPRSFDERHSSLLAALDWSYDLLEDSERTVLLALSVFLTPFTQEDAGAVSDKPDVEDDVARLVEVSLLEPPNHSGEYRFLEPVRQYARHRLATSGGLLTARRRHANWMVVATRRASEEQWSPRMREVHGWIFKKRDEMLAVINWALEIDDPDTVLAIVAAIGQRLIGLGVEGSFVAPAEAAIHHPGATHNHDYVIASTHTSFMIWLEGRKDEARNMLVHALTIAEDANDLIGQGEVKHRLGTFMDEDKTGAEASSLMDEATELLRKGGDPIPERHLYNVAVMHMFVGQFTEAARVIEDHRRWYETTFGVAEWGYRGIMGELREREGALEAALELYKEAATLAEADSMYMHAAGFWDAVGYTAVRVRSADSLSKAAQNHRRMIEMTGARSSVPLEIEIALAAEDFANVLRLAEEWFTIKARDSEAEHLLISSDHEETIHGSRLREPRIFAILRPVAAALMATGRSDEACRIVNAVPGLMEQSPFEYWAECREAELWEPLVDRCAASAEADTDPLTLQDVFELVKGLVTRGPGTG